MQTIRGNLSDLEGSGPRLKAAHIATRKALVTTSEALVTNSFLLLLLV